MPPPTGVVSGPLMATTCSRMASTVACGSHSPVALWAFSPAKISFHTIRLPPPKAFSTAPPKGAPGARREPLPRRLVALLAGQNLLPHDPFTAAEGFLNGGVDHPHARAPDVGAGAVPLDEGDGGVIGDVKPAILELDPMPRGGGLRPSRPRHLLLRGPSGPLRFGRRAPAFECPCSLGTVLGRFP